VPHAFSPKPNDTDCPPNFYDSGNNPQYKFFGKNMDYLNRMCHMLSDGEHICNIAILYDAENRWANEEFLPLEKIAKVLFDNHYDYEIIPADYLDKIDSKKYKHLIVPYSSCVNEKMFQKITDTDMYVTVVHDDECKQYNLPCHHIHIERLINHLDSHKLYDVKTDYEGIFLRHFHYSRDGAHIYMFTNEDINNTINANVTLSAFDGGRYIEYDGFENKAVSKTAQGDIELSISPYNSVMIIFGDVSFDGTDEYLPISLGEAKMINPVFDISVAEKNSDLFKPYKTTDRLFNITGREGLTRFSGHIKYEAEIYLDKKNYILDLGYVGEVAEVYLNDTYIGTCQIPPYRFDISADIIGDTNKLTVVVTNHNGYDVRDGFSSFMLFEPSGLLGPVSIMEVNNDN
jgi:hypothetical protein